MLAAMYRVGPHWSRSAMAGMPQSNSWLPMAEYSTWQASKNSFKGLPWVIRGKYPPL